MTTTQTQIRRDTAANLAAATPAAGELGWDTTNERLVGGNGSTAGGVKQASAKDVQNSNFTYASAGGSANAITLTLSPAPASYAAGQEFLLKATATNTGATTLNVNSLGAKNIYKMSSGTLGAISAGDIVSGGVYSVKYDGTQFQLSTVAGSGIISVKKQSFTGSGTYTPSAGMVYCMIEAVGGGGGGGNGGSSQCGSGGGYGAYSRRLCSASDIGASKTVTIGSGGSAASTGGTTSVGTLVSATGGVGGATASAAAYQAGGLGGTASNGDVNVTGQQGGLALGGSFNGAGASGPFGTGGAQIVSGATPSAGSGYGSGGAGGFGTGGGATGASGAAGFVIITEFCTV